MRILVTGAAGLSWVTYHIYAYTYGLPRVCRECLGIAPRAWYWHGLKTMGSGLVIYGTIRGAARLVWKLFDSLTGDGLGVGTIIYAAVAYAMMGDVLREDLSR